MTNPHEPDAQSLAQALFEESADALFLFDPENDRLLQVNPVALRLTGYGTQEILSQPATYFFRFQGRGGRERLREASRHTGIFHSQEGYFLRTAQDGVWIPVNLSVSRLHVRPKTLALITARDVREQHETHQRLQRLESELGRLTSSVAACLWSAEIDRSGRWDYRYWSPAVEVLTGRTPGHFLSERGQWEEVVHPQDRPRWQEGQARLRAGQAWQDEYRVVRPDGSVRWVREAVTVTPLAGPALRLDAVLVDVTEQRAAEEARREGEALFKGFMENSPAIAWMKDEQGRHVFVNRRYMELFDIPAEKWMGLTDFEVWPKEAAQKFQASDQAVLDSGQPLQLFDNVTDAAGTPHCWWVFKFPFQDAAGRRYVGGMAVDVIEREQAARALREQQTFLRNLIAHLPCAVFWKDRHSVYLGCNDKVAHDLRLSSPAEAVGKSDYDLQFGREEADFFVRCDRQVMESGEPLLNFEETQRRADGRQEVLLTSKVPLRDTEGQVIGVLGIYSDITDRKRMEEALRQSEERYRSVVESTIEGILIHQDGRICFANLAVARLHGFDRPEEMIGLDVDILVAPEERARIHERREARLRGEQLEPQHEWQGLRRDGSRVWIQSTVTPITWDGRPAFLSTRMEVTERRRLQEQLRQSQKMEAIGRLAGGVAHDFNNLLTVITGYTDLLLNGLTRTDPLFPQLEEIGKAAERATGLTRQLLAFGRKSMLAPQVLDLNLLIGDLEKMLARLIGEDIELATQLDPGLGQTRADPGQIQQVLMNLVVNARDAMPQGGHMLIWTANAELDAAYAREHLEVQPGPYVLLAVRDTGGGMDAQTRAHLFEPFFTTKEVGKGTGLGLATVYGIVKQSGGHIDVESVLGKGSTFRVYLPRIDRPVSVRAAETERPPRGSETMLLVEDEEMVRTYACLALRQGGYTVLEAANGPEALKIAAHHRGPLDLLVTDVVMPGMSGRELAERLTAERPGLRVLYMSGYTDDAVLRHGVSEAEMAFLAKPFPPGRLLARVREVLDE